MFNKQAMAECLVAIISAKLVTDGDNLAKEGQNVIETPPCREDDPDTTRYERSYVCDEKHSMHTTWLNALRKLKKIIPYLGISNTGLINVGSVFRLSNMSKDEQFYFIVPDQGGISFDYENHAITTVSVSAPIAQLVMGKEKDDLIVFIGREHQILETF